MIDRDDKRHKVWDEILERRTNAVIIAMMDVSGSMGDDAEGHSSYRNVLD